MPLKKDYHRRCVRNVARCMILIIPNARSVNMITRVRWVFDKFQFGRYSLAIYPSIILAATECSHGRLRVHRRTPGEGSPTKKQSTGLFFLPLLRLLALGDFAPCGERLGALPLRPCKGFSPLDPRHPFEKGWTETFFNFGLHTFIRMYNYV